MRIPTKDSPPLHLRIFLASPGDVAEERKLAHQVIDALQYDPALRGKITVEIVAWDKFGPPMQAGLTPQEAINQGMSTTGPMCNPSPAHARAKGNQHE